jgi:hypothetical protein
MRLFASVEDEPGNRVRREVDGLDWVENPVVDWSSVADDMAGGPD